MKKVIIVICLCLLLTLTIAVSESKAQYIHEGYNVHITDQGAIAYTIGENGEEIIHEFYSWKEYEMGYGVNNAENKYGIIFCRHGTKASSPSKTKWENKENIVYYFSEQQFKDLFQKFFDNEKKRLKQIQPGLPF